MTTGDITEPCANCGRPQLPANNSYCSVCWHNGDVPDDDRP